MSTATTLLPQIQCWFSGFFITMGSALAVATAFSFGIITTHWLYLCARTIESKPTSPSFSTTMVRMSGFQALVVGVVLVPFGTTTLYYFLFTIVWKLAPPMPATPPDVAPFPDFGPAATDAGFSIMASLVICLVALAVLIAGGSFFLLRNYAEKINEQNGSIGFIKWLVRRYFHDSTLIGCLLAFIACPVIFFFLYNMALLTMLLAPSAVALLPKLAIPGAENLYMRSLEIGSSWLIVILFIPAFWLLLRGLRLRVRYTIENPTMKLIFVRSAKFFCLGLFGWIGNSTMYLLAHSLFKLFS